MKTNEGELLKSYQAEFFFNALDIYNVVGSIGFLVDTRCSFRVMSQTKVKVLKRTKGNYSKIEKAELWFF